MAVNNIEAEIKYAITPAKAVALGGIIVAQGFKRGGKEKIIDRFIEISKSKYGGWDFIRLRDIGGGLFIKTQKKWLVKDGSRIRVENEKEVSRAYYIRLVKKALKVVIEKERTNFYGKLDGRKVTVSLDELLISGKKYCFIECETMTDMASSTAVRVELKHWLKAKLKINVGQEAPSMLDFAYSFTNNSK